MEDEKLEAFIQTAVDLRDDMLMRAKMNAHLNDGEIVVEAGNGVWRRFNDAIDAVFAPGALSRRPSPTEQDVERVARAICYANCITAHPDDPERAQCQADNGWDMWLPEARAAISTMAEGVAAEREACARIAEEHFEGHGALFGTARANNYEIAGKRIAAAIRARGGE